jgi:hypothetical protein
MIGSGEPWRALVSRRLSFVFYRLKLLLLSADETRSERWMMAVAVFNAVSAAFKLVEPVDLQAQVFRWLLLVPGSLAAIFLIWLMFFPPRNPGLPSSSDPSHGAQS